MILAAAATLALVSATPAFACPDCHDCPAHKDKVAAADKAAKKEGDKGDQKAACACRDHKDCKCGGKCVCANKAEKKDPTKA
jgi:hypothetical protein